MTGVSSGSGAPARMQLRDLDPKEYEHPLDGESLDALQQAKGFDVLLRKVSAYTEERVQRLLVTGNSLRVSKRSFPELHARFTSLCEQLDMSFEPELFIERGDEINGYTSGVDKPVIVITSGCVDLLLDDEVDCLLGHELGHIKSGHVLYGMVAQQLPLLADVIGEATLGLGRFFTKGVEIALFHWYRMSELTADRAGLLACQNVEAAIKLEVKLAGLPTRYYDTFDTSAFIEQARTFEGLDSDTVNVFHRAMLTTYMTHPWSVLRASELVKWIESGDYNRVLRRATARSNHQSTRTPHVGYSRSDRAAAAALASKHQDFVEYLRARVMHFGSGNVFIAPEIPAEKLTNAVQSYMGNVRPSEVLVLYDSTVFGGAREGFAITETKLLWKNTASSGMVPLREASVVQTQSSNSMWSQSGIIINNQRVEVSDAGDLELLKEIVAAAYGWHMLTLNA